MIYVLGAAIILAALYGLTKLASSDRYAKMTSEEFEAEARRSSLLGAAMVGMQKVIDPDHQVQYVEAQKNRAEAESSHSGDCPPEETSNK